MYIKYNDWFENKNLKINGLNYQVLSLILNTKSATVTGIMCEPYKFFFSPLVSFILCLE